MEKGMPLKSSSLPLWWNPTPSAAPTNSKHRTTTIVATTPLAAKTAKTSLKMWFRQSRRWVSSLQHLRGKKGIWDLWAEEWGRRLAQLRFQIDALCQFGSRICSKTLRRILLRDYPLPRLSNLCKTSASVVYIRIEVKIWEYGSQIARR